MTPYFLCYFKFDYLQVEQESQLSTPDFRLDELMHLAELCIEVTQQNEEYHSEVNKLKVIY